MIGFLEALKNGPYDCCVRGSRRSPIRLSASRRRRAGPQTISRRHQRRHRFGRDSQSRRRRNRVAAYAYARGSLFLVAGVNKIVPDIGGVRAAEEPRRVEECRH